MMSTPLKDTMVETDFSMSQLLAMMNDKINHEIVEYNSLIDQLENMEVELNAVSAINRKLTDELKIAQEHSTSVEEASSRLKLKLQEVSESDRKARLAFDVATESLKKKALQIKELQTALKALKEFGDPKKLMDNNRDLRARNKQLMDLNDQLKSQNQAYEKNYKQLVEKSEYNQLPSFTSAANEQLFIHPNLVSCDTPEGPRDHVALTYWNADGIGRLVTWNGKRPRFASFKHKTVDEKWAPSAEAVQWAANWFEEHVAYTGEHQVIRTKFMVKGR